MLCCLRSSSALTNHGTTLCVCRLSAGVARHDYHQVTLGQSFGIGPGLVHDAWSVSSGQQALSLSWADAPTNRVTGRPSSLMVKKSIVYVSQRRACTRQQNCTEIKFQFGCIARIAQNEPNGSTVRCLLKTLSFTGRSSSVNFSHVDVRRPTSA